MKNNIFEVGKTYVNLSEHAGKTITRQHPEMMIRKSYYVPKEITITARTGSFYTAVDDKGNELTTDNDDRHLYAEKDK